MTRGQKRLCTTAVKISTSAHEFSYNESLTKRSSELGVFRGKDETRRDKNLTVTVRGAKSKSSYVIKGRLSVYQLSMPVRAETLFFGLRCTVLFSSSNLDGVDILSTEIQLQLSESELGKRHLAYSSTWLTAISPTLRASINFAKANNFSGEHSLEENSIVDSVQDKKALHI